MRLRMGLVGAGPWAAMFHAPMLAAGPRTSLDVVWARRSEAAEELASSHGATAVSSYEELLDRCDGVAFAVPPDVQAELAPAAAQAGRHLLLEKPLAFTVAEAERIATAVDEAGVRTVLMLRNRFTSEGRRFVEPVRGADARGAQARFVTGAALEGSPFATPWRVERGALFDLGPHVLDLLDAALGPVVHLSAAGDPRRLLTVATQHEDGAVAQAALSITTPGTDGTLRIEAWTAKGPVAFDGRRSDDDPHVTAALAASLADAVETGADHPVDVHRGLYLQRLLARVEDALR
jgi:predicted dehydrogenase